MRLVNEQGFEEDAAYDADLLAFEFEGMEIRNPFISDCGRFPADPVTDYGFKTVGTGGGCEALIKQLEHGHYLMLTCDDGVCIPDNEHSSEALIGRYNEEGEMLAICSIKEVVMDGETPAKEKTRKNTLSDGPGF